MTATILVVDDEPDLEVLVMQKFRRQICDGAVTFVFAHDGIEALQMIEQHPHVDMVVSDINMPRMDGLSLLQKLQEADDKKSIIIVSAYGDMRNIRTAMNRGAFDFLTKPIEFFGSRNDDRQNHPSCRNDARGTTPPSRGRACVCFAVPGTVTTKGSKGAQSLAPVLETGRKLGFTVESINIDDLADLAKALSPEVLAGFDAFVFIPDAVLNAHMAEIIRMLGLSRKPAIFPSPDWVANGGFMSFGPDFSDAHRQLISQLDRVLKGAKPGDLPFQRPTKFDLRINLRIAKALGIELSPTVLARADQVIE